jgi:hypothetical protein
MKMLNKRKGNWIETYTGRQFWPLDPRSQDVDIIDIAHSLSMQCRFNGHTRVFYSVAEHSLIVSAELAACGESRLVQLYGLLHDAAEAYVCDLPRPVKSQIESYKPIEEAVQKAVLNALGLPHPGEYAGEKVKRMDCLVLGHEGKTLMHNAADWTSAFDLFQPRTVYSFKMGLSPNEAERRFIARFYELMKVKTEAVQRYERMA